MKVKDILDRVTTLYNDLEYIRVPESLYLKFIDDALNQLVLLRPDCHVKTAVVKLNKGTRQTLPEDGCTLIEIYMNKKKEINPSSGEEEFFNYYPITHVERNDLDFFSNWQSYSNAATSKDYITEFSYEKKSPKVYWVSPYVGEKDVYVEMDYSYTFPRVGDMLPDDTGSYIEAEQTEIDLQDIWLGPLCNYVLYNLYNVDSTSQLDRQIAQSYLQAFYQSVSLEDSSASAVVPEIKPAVPVVPGGNA